MRPDCIEVAPPTFDDNLGLPQRIEDFAIEEFVAKAGIKTLDVTILPRAARHSIFSSVVRAVLDEVVGPDVIAAFGTQPDA